MFSVRIAAGFRELFCIIFDDTDLSSSFANLSNVIC